MATWRWTLGVLALVLGLCAQATAGKGKGKPGGGDPPPTPPGTIYFQVEGDGTWSMDAAGADKLFLFPAGPGREGVQPSHQIHDGNRWFALGRQTTDLLPDGNYRRELVARSDTGTEVLLWSAAGADVRPSKAWAKDDSFVSFKIARPADATSDVLRADIDWSTGVPALGATTVVLEGVLVTFPSATIPMPTYEGFDWSPDGEAIVYAERDFVTGGLNLFVKDLMTSTTVALGSGRLPQWSFDGSRIAFQGVITGVFTIGPDGLDLTEVRPYGERPVWSPDGSWVAVTAAIQTGRGKKAKIADEVVRIPSQGGAETNLTTDVDANVSTLGWRD